MPPTPEQKKELETAVKAFRGTVKEKTGVDLAKAIVEAVSGERLDSEMVMLLDSIVQETTLDVVELRILHQLAARAGAARAGEWDDETARTIWDTVGLAEEANNRPFALPWVRSLLDSADALRREAEVLILPEAFGFASGAQITKAWQGVRDAYAFVDICYRRIRDARRGLDRARFTLSAVYPYLEATGSRTRGGLARDRPDRLRP